VGRKLAEIDAETRRTTSTYDAAGRRIELTDAEGGVMTYLFDPVNRDVGGLDALHRRTTYGYDGAGSKVLKITACNDRITYLYDPVNRKTNDVYAGHRHTYGYDPGGNRTNDTGPTKFEDWDRARPVAPEPMAHGPTVDCGNGRWYRGQG